MPTGCIPMGDHDARIFQNPQMFHDGEAGYFEVGTQLIDIDVWCSP